MRNKGLNVPYSGDDFTNLLSDKGELFFKYIFESNYREFCILSFKYVGRTDIAEDIVQDIFINIWNKRFQLNCKGNIKPYLIRSVINASINYIQSQYAKQHMVEQDFACRVPTESNTSDVLLKNELANLIKSAIEMLPDKCRTIFMFSRFSELSYKEISEQLNISIKTVETQISIALKRIHQYLSKYGYLLFFLKYFL